MMPLGILDRIVAVCHTDRLKISTLQDLCKQMDWNKAIASLYWDSIHAIIQVNNDNHPDLFTSIHNDAALSNPSMSLPEDGSAPKHRKVTCSVCKKDGHMMTSKKCLMYSSRAAKENRTPATPIATGTNRNQPLATPITPSVSRQYVSSPYQVELKSVKIWSKLILSTQDKGR